MLIEWRGSRFAIEHRDGQVELRFMEEGVIVFDPLNVPLLEEVWNGDRIP